MITQDSLYSRQNTFRLGSHIVINCYFFIRLFTGNFVMNPTIRKLLSNINRLGRILESEQGPSGPSHS